MNKIYSLAFDNVISKKNINFDEIIEILKICLENGVNINRKKSHILIDAIRYDNLQIINFLIDNGINIHSGDDSALIYACKNNYVQSVELLLVLGCKADTQNNQPIYIICDYHNKQKKINIDIVKLLVNHGANPFSHSNKLLQKACEIEDFELVKYLISIGANCAEPNNKPISLAFANKENYELKKILLDNGASPNVTNDTKMHLLTGSHASYPCNLLERSLLHCDIESCKLLISYGADINLCLNLINNRNKIHYDFHKYDFCGGINYAEKKKKIVALFLECGLDIDWILNDLESSENEKDDD